jgi:ubiquinol-cytochrome c reductase cytochrome c subunit
MRGGRQALAWALLLVPPAVGVIVVMVLPFGAASALRGRARFDARTTFLADCATCHGATAHGTARGPSIRSSSGGLLDYVMSTGRMPLRSPHEVPRRTTPRYTPAEIASLISYILSITHAPRDDVGPIDLTHANLADGGELFRLNCAACHAWSGTGGALLHREAPSLRPSTPRQIAQAVRSGPGAMPSFGQAALTDHQLTDVISYVRYLARPNDRGGFPLWHIGPIVEGFVGFAIGTGTLLLVARAIGTRS